MRIKEEIKKQGYFWLPSKPERKIPGTLTISDGGDIELETIGLFNDFFEEIPKIFNQTIKVQRIIGAIDEHGLVTLDDCIQGNASFSFNNSGNFNKVSYSARVAYFGVAYNDGRNPMFSTFQFSIEGIDEWVGLSGINIAYAPNLRTASVSYLPLDDVLINLNNGMKLLITFSYTLPNPSPLTEAKITQKAYFKLLSEQQFCLEDFIDVAYKLTTFISLAIDKTVCIESVSATSKDILQQISEDKTVPISISVYYQSLPFVKNIPKITWRSMLFRYPNIANNIEHTINNWINFYDEIDSALNLYFATRSGAHKHFEGIFLSLVQALETYQRRTSDEKLMDETKFSELINNLIRLCPEENREWLEGRLRYGNEINLRKRIKNIIEPFKELFESNGTRNTLINNIVDTRNYLTHYSKELEQKAIKGVELFRLNRKIEAIFQLHLLQKLGFTKEEIQSIIASSSELQNKLQAR